MVSFGAFVEEVKKEIEYFEAGGTSWRKQVASLSEFLLIQTPIRTVEYYSDKNAVISLVKDLTPGLNNDELIEDIGNFLSHIAKNMIFKANLPDEVSEYVEMQRQKREGKPLRFKNDLIPLAKGKKLKFSDIEKFPPKTEIISGRLLWSEEEIKAVILGVLTATGLDYLVNNVLPERSVDELRKLLFKGEEKIFLSDDEIEDMKLWDNAFPNGVYAVPRPVNAPRVKVKKLWDYCEQRGVEPSQLSEEDMQQFLVKMIITSVYPTRTFLLLLEFDMKEYRILDMKKFLKDDKGLLADIRDNVDLFLDVKVDNVAGTVCWSNGADFEPDILYRNSVSIKDPSK